MKVQNYSVHKDFYSDYRNLRTEFENNFRDAKATHQKRFVWDYWYDEDQYHLIRTPAFYYFNKKNYANFHSYLVQWGRENLGCHDISPPWLSYYVDGCFQNMHSDVPHGPWAFVYSLTPDRSKEFRGGETFILKQKTLNYWPQFNETKDYEYKSFVDLIPSRMNQLVLFDPRYPHGVTEVKGTRDPLKGRLVIHGWFVNPRPYVVGGLKTSQVQKGLTSAFAFLSQTLAQIDLLHGTISIRLNVGADGSIKQYKLVRSTVLSLKGLVQDEVYLLKELKNIFSQVKFPKATVSSQITIPLLFK